MNFELERMWEEIVLDYFSILFQHFSQIEKNYKIFLSQELICGSRIESRTAQIKGWGSSVSIVSDYRLDYLATGVRSLAEAKYFFSSLCVQTSSGTHPASCPMDTGGKVRLGRDTDYSSPSGSKARNE
jgi:hypothetical protein